jgi:hypothetical protein
MTNPTPALRPLRVAAAAATSASAKPFQYHSLRAACTRPLSPYQTFQQQASLYPCNSRARNITTSTPTPVPSSTAAASAQTVRNHQRNHHHQHVHTRRMLIHTTGAAPTRPIRPNLPLRPGEDQRPRNQPEPTDFGALDVLAGAPVPSTAVEVCRADGFDLNSGVKITGGAGALLVGGEAFVWRPWEVSWSSSSGKEGGKGKRKLLNAKGQWEVQEEAFGLLGLIWPRPGRFLSFCCCSLLLYSLACTILQLDLWTAC